MSLTQATGGQHWAEPAAIGVTQSAAPVAITDDGTQMVPVVGGVAAYRLMDTGAGQFVPVAIASVNPANPELTIVCLGGGNLFAYA